MNNPQSAIRPNFILRLTLSHMQPRMRRLVYITSLAAVIRNTKDLDALILDKMNEELNLADINSEALKLPALVCNKIWNNQSVIAGNLDCLKDVNSDGLLCLESIRTIIEHTPKWFKYDEDKNIIEDITSLLRLNKTLLKSVLEPSEPLALSS